MKKFFSLIEMMVVLAIIAILVSFLLPGLGKARAQARTAQCASQMHQVGLASQMYLSDNDNYFNPKKYQREEYYTNNQFKERNSTGYGTVSYYATNVYFDYQYVQKKELFICPSNTESALDAYSTSMTFNMEITTRANGKGILPYAEMLGQKSYLKSVHIKNPSQKLLTVDTSDGWLKNNRMSSVTVRHQGQKINHLWADGHGSSLKYTQTLANPQWLTPTEDSALWSAENGISSFTFQ